MDVSGLVGLEGVGLEVLLLLVLAGLAAGFVDAVVGGGGLLQLPVMLMVPGISPVQALATNKMGSVFGTLASSVTYARRVRMDLRFTVPAALLAGLAAAGGAALASALPKEVIEPVVFGALVLVLLFTVFQPKAGELTRLRHQGARHVALGAAIGVGIGFYDGVMGPGTGSFLVIAMVTLSGFSFLVATAQAKVVNLATNLGALAWFFAHGSVLWQLGLLVGSANMLGGYLGARTAVARGGGFIRTVFLVVVSVLILRLGWTVFLSPS